MISSKNVVSKFISSSISFTPSSVPQSGKQPPGQVPGQQPQQSPAQKRIELLKKKIKPTQQEIERLQKQPNPQEKKSAETGLTESKQNFVSRVMPREKINMVTAVVNTQPIQAHTLLNITGQPVDLMNRSMRLLGITAAEADFLGFSFNNGIWSIMVKSKYIPSPEDRQK